MLYMSRMAQPEPEYIYQFENFMYEIKVRRGQYIKVITQVSTIFTLYIHDEVEYNQINNQAHAILGSDFGGARQKLFIMNQNNHGLPISLIRIQVEEEEGTLTFSEMKVHRDVGNKLIQIGQAFENHGPMPEGHLPLPNAAEEVNALQNPPPNQNINNNNIPMNGGKRRKTKQKNKQNKTNKLKKGTKK